LLVASLLKRNAVSLGLPVEVFAHKDVCSILKQDPFLKAREGNGGRSPLSILRHALTGNLLQKEFKPLGPEGRRTQTNDCHSRPRIGFAWASIDNNIIEGKYIPREDFKNIFKDIKGEFISFQRKLKDADRNFLHDIEARIIPDDSSIDILVQEIRQLDCMVTISTTTAHIAASLGIWVELIAAERQGPQWFWQAQANHEKKFYPSVKVRLGEGRKGKWYKKCIKQVRSSLLSLRGNNCCM
jgi:hypothetical protein